MTIEVLLFAQLREALGRERVLVDTEGPRTVGEVAAEILAGRNLGSLPLRFAVNEVFVDEFHQLNDGDRIALITPVSGG